MPVPQMEDPSIGNSRLDEIQPKKEKNIPVFEEKTTFGTDCNISIHWSPMMTEIEFKYLKSWLKLNLEKMEIACGIPPVTKKKKTS